jgi:hypothetical protein
VLEQGAHRVSLIRCVAENCRALSDHGGAIWTVGCPVAVSGCAFRNNSARFSGSVEFRDSPAVCVNDTAIAQGRAERFGAGQVDGHSAADRAELLRCNVTGNRADRWIGGLRLQHNGGGVAQCRFQRNSAEAYGALWDYGHSPALRRIELSAFVNNTAREEGAAFTAYHVVYSGAVERCAFWGNRNGSGRGGRSVYLYAYAARLLVRECAFEGSAQEELAVQFPSDSSLNVSESNRFGAGAQADHGH